MLSQSRNLLSFETCRLVHPYNVENNDKFFLITPVIVQQQKNNRCIPDGETWSQKFESVIDMENGQSKESEIEHSRVGNVHEQEWHERLKSLFAKKNKEENVKRKRKEFDSFSPGHKRQWTTSTVDYVLGSIFCRLAWCNRMWGHREILLLWWSKSLLGPRELAQWTLVDGNGRIPKNLKIFCILCHLSHPKVDNIPSILDFLSKSSVWFPSKNSPAGFRSMSSWNSQANRVPQFSPFVCFKWFLTTH